MSAVVCIRKSGIFSALGSIEWFGFGGLLVAIVLDSLWKESSITLGTSRIVRKRFYCRRGEYIVSSDIRRHLKGL